MDQTASPEAIRDDIQRRRQQMTDDVNELEERARSLTDWRQQVRERPLMAAGAALTVGLVLGVMTSGSSDSDRRYGGSRFSGQATQAGKHQAVGRIDEIRGTLMSLASTKAQEFLREAMPGNQQGNNRTQELAGSRVHRSASPTDESRQVPARARPANEAGARS